MAFQETISAAARGPDQVSARAASLASLAGVSGVGAVLASSCCVLPLALGFLGAGTGVFTSIEALAAWRMPLLAGSALALAGGWYFYLRRASAPCGPTGECAVPTRSLATGVGLAVATKLTALAFAGPWIEPIILRLL